MNTPADWSERDRRAALKARTATLVSLSLHVDGGEALTLAQLRRAWTLAGHGALVPLDADALGAHLHAISDSCVGAEESWLTAFLVQDGRLCGHVQVRPRASAEGCEHDARALLAGADEHGGARSVLICASAWYGVRERPAPGQDPDDFAFAEAAGEWSGFRLI